MNHNFDQEMEEKHKKLIEQRLKEKAGPVSKRQCTNLLKKNAFNDTFFAKYSQEELDLMVSEKHMVGVLQEIEALSQSYCADTKILFEFTLKKCC